MKTRIKNNYKALVKSIVDATPTGYEGNRIERELVTLSWKDFVSEVEEEFDVDPDNMESNSWSLYVAVYNY